MKKIINFAVLAILSIVVTGCIAPASMRSGTIVSIGMPYTRITVVNGTSDQMEICAKSRYGTDTVQMVPGESRELSNNLTPFGAEGDQISFIARGKDANGYIRIGTRTDYLNKYIASRVYVVKKSYDGYFFDSSGW